MQGGFAHLTTFNGALFNLASPRQRLYLRMAFLICSDRSTSWKVVFIHGMVLCT